MTDELDELKAALGDATPEADPATRAAHLRLAEENFARLQGSTSAARPNSKRAMSVRIGNGVRTMLTSLTTRGGLTATTALAAVAVVAVLPWDDLRAPVPAPVVTEIRQAPTPVEGQERLETDGTSAIAQTQVLPEQAQPLADQNGPAVSFLAEPQTRSVDSLVLEPEIIFEEAVRLPDVNSERFSNAPDNPVQVVAENPVSTFSIDVDTASYSVVRSSLMRGQLPPREAVRAEEMINYFPYDYTAPDGEEPFSTTVSVLETPWNADTQLLHLGIQSTLPAIEERPPLNLVFLIDTSGSMDDPAKLPLLKQSFRLMLSELRPEDQVAIVTYAGSAGLVLEATPASDRAAILASLEALDAGGSTAGQAGLQQAYATAAAMAEEGEVTRVILATDGDFNVGISDPAALEEFIAARRDSGTYLSVLGFGRGNLDDATMQALAQNGNGMAAYIDSLSEARKVLVDQLTGALFPIAEDVKIQVEFNPAQVAEYRLIGYETRALRREDFNNDRVDAGEIGAGHSVTAIYEITPTGSAAVLSDPLRYAPEASVNTSDELAFLRLRYKSPGAEESQLIEQPVLPGVSDVTDDVRFSAAVAGFAQLLRGQSYVGNWGYADALALAQVARGADRFGYRGEAITLMQLAESLSQN